MKKPVCWKLPFLTQFHNICSDCPQVQSGETSSQTFPVNTTTPPTTSVETTSPISKQNMSILILNNYEAELNKNLVLYSGHSTPY